MEFISTMKCFKATEFMGRFTIYTQGGHLAGLATPRDYAKPWNGWTFTALPFAFTFTSVQLLDVTCILSQIKQHYLKQHLGNDYIED